MNNQITFEEIQDHLANSNLADFEEGGERSFNAMDVAGDPAGVLQRICSLYRIIRPILNGILLIPLIPANIKNAIRVFMGAMDMLCP